MNVKVLSKFVDKYDFSKTYNPDDIVDSFDDARIKDLVERGLVEVEGKKEPKEPKDPITLTDIDMTQGWQKVVSEIKGFNDLEKLKAYLEAETKADKPRNPVVSALDARIKELTPKE